MCHWYTARCRWSYWRMQRPSRQAASEGEGRASWHWPDGLSRINRIDNSWKVARVRKEERYLRRHHEEDLQLPPKPPFLTEGGLLDLSRECIAAHDLSSLELIFLEFTNSAVLYPRAWCQGLGVCSISMARCTRGLWTYLCNVLWQSQYFLE